MQEGLILTMDVGKEDVYKRQGLGYALILVIVGAVREFLGRGSLLGFQLIPEGAYNFGYVNNGMMTMPAMALILVGCVIWVHRAYIYKEEK